MGRSVRDHSHKGKEVDGVRSSGGIVVEGLRGDGLGRLRTLNVELPTSNVEL
jgi:hypothetical protein